MNQAHMLTGKRIIGHALKKPISPFRKNSTQIRVTGGRSITAKCWQRILIRRGHLLIPGILLISPNLGLVYMDGLNRKGRVVECKSPLPEFIQ